MGEKNNDGFLTCMEACDTIALLCKQDINSLIVNREFMSACMTVLATRLVELPVDMVKPIAEVQKSIYDLLGIEVYEDFNSGPWSKVLNV